MYSWGDDTSTWTGPGSYDYGSARRAYLDSLAKAGPRTYAARSEPDMKLVAPQKTIRSESKNPVVIAVDVTGSMAHWPAEIFDRLPLLYQTLTKYQPDVEFCFAAIGDASCDAYPLQVNDFAKETDLDAKLKALCAEGGGGGQHFESYELFAQHTASRCETPNATSPFLIVFGDEGFYPKVNPDQAAHYLGAGLEAEVDSQELWQSLLQKFDVYHLHKEYADLRLDKEIVSQWQSALGKQRVIPLFEAERAVDVAMGLIAKRWGHFGDFEDNLSARHDASESASVYASLRHVPAATTDGKSAMTRTGTAGKSTALDGEDDA